MATIIISTNNSQFIRLFENLAAALKVPFKTDATPSKSLQKAFKEEEEGLVTKLMNHKNAVKEILEIKKTIDGYK